MEVLLISAHPDDETLGAGGTLALHRRRGDRVTVLIVTEGVTARHEVVDLQLAAARKACAVLGVDDVRFAGLRDQRLDATPLLDVVKPISDLVAELKPDVVYTHHRGDCNQDHRAVFAATLVAVRPLPGNPVRRVLCYEVASSTEWAPPFSEWAFLPNVFVDVAGLVETKVKALEAYGETFQTEIKPFPHPRSPEAVRLRARQRGMEVGIEAAEAFVLLREVDFSPR